MLAGATGLEPATSAVTGQRSNQLSYAPVKGGGNVGNHSSPVNSRFGNRACEHCHWHGRFLRDNRQQNFHRAYCNHGAHFYSARQLNREK